MGERLKTIRYEETTDLRKRKRLNLSQIGAATRLRIVKLAASKTRTHQEIADMFNVRASAVSRLSSDLNRSNSAIVKRREKELKRQQMNGAIIYVL